MVSKHKAEEKHREKRDHYQSLPKVRRRNVQLLERQKNRLQIFFARSSKVTTVLDTATKTVIDIKKNFSCIMKE